MVFLKKRLKKDRLLSNTFHNYCYWGEVLWYCGVFIGPRIQIIFLVYFS